MKSMRLCMICFLAILAVFALNNAELIEEPINGLFAGDKSFVEFRDEIQAAYKTDETYLKEEFINLNGLYLTAIGRRVINNTVVLKNGMLNHSYAAKTSMNQLAQKIIDFNETLEFRGIPFIYVQAPYKVDVNGMLLPCGVENYSHENANDLLMELENAQIDTVDLRSLVATSEEVERNFYRTDHHWNADGAFSGFAMIAEHLQRVLEDSSNIGMYVNIDNWKKHVVSDIFLGSQGKRVGKYVAGLDDFVYYTPEFDTHMSCAVMNHRTHDKGTFEEAIIRKQHTRNEKGFFKSNAYVTYIGGDYPLVQHRNELAPVKKKLLLIKDSFMLPVQSFLSTIYQEIDVIDPRHYLEFSLSEYTYLSSVDAVVMMINPTVFPQALSFEYGSQEDIVRILKQQNGEMIIDGQDVLVEESESQYRYEIISEGFAENSIYTFTANDIRVLKGDADCAVVSLYNPETEKCITSTIFDLEYCDRHGGYRWYFKTPKEDCSMLQLLVYSGQPKETRGIEMAYDGINLYQGYLAEANEPAD